VPPCAAAAEPATVGGRRLGTGGRAGPWLRQPQRFSATFRRGFGAPPSA
jgi:hypothetical protein